MGVSHLYTPTFPFPAHGLSFGLSFFFGREVTNELSQIRWILRWEK